MSEEFHSIDDLQSKDYRLEMTEAGPTLRIHIQGQRAGAYILVEADKDPRQYLRLDMPVQDKRVLRGWMKGKRRNNNKTK